MGMPTSEQLLRRAGDARTHAYAPYSGLAVGAALLAEDGRIFTGCNVENASLGLTVCAERTALFRAVSEGARRFRAIAVRGPDDARDLFPCGSCRQALVEFAPDISIVTGSPSAPYEHRLADLMPHPFTALDVGTPLDR